MEPIFLFVMSDVPFPREGSSTDSTSTVALETLNDVATALLLATAHILQVPMRSLLEVQKSF